MTEQPTVTERDAQPYAGIVRAVTMAELGSVLPPLHGQVADWLARHDAAPAGPPFWRYRVIDMERQLQVEVGFPTDAVWEAEGEVETGELPAGRYVTVRHTGHPDELADVTGRLLDWADHQGLRFDRHDSPEGDAWASRLEIYLTDPDDEPDLTRWTTELAFKLAD